MSAADYGGQPESLIGNVKTDYKSTSGSAACINGNIVSWSSRKQSTVALSSCESEYYAANETASTIIWLNSLLSGLYFVQPSPSKLYVDNEVAISVAKAVYTGRKIRHVAIPWHRLKSLVADNQIDIQWVDTKSQLADIFTKGLKKDLFIPLRDRLVANHLEGYYIYVLSPSCKGTEEDSRATIAIIIYYYYYYCY